MRKGSGLQRGQLCPLVIILPGALETESKAAPQEIRVPDSIIRYANRRSLLPIEDCRIVAFLCIKIEVGFHTAGKHIQFGLTAGPERSQ
jgi:hypothetical protein